MTVYATFDSVRVILLTKYRSHQCVRIAQHSQQCANSQKVDHILLHCQERNLAQICTNQRCHCQYQGYSCHTALDQLSKRHRKLPEGSLSPYIMYAGSAIVPSMTSREAHPRSTATGRRIVGVAMGHFGQRFSPTKRRPKITQKIDKPYTTVLVIIKFPFRSSFTIVERSLRHHSCTVAKSYLKFDRKTFKCTCTWISS